MSKGWKECRLGDLFQIKHGYAFKGQYFGSEGSHIVLTPGNFYDEGGFKKKGEKEKWYSGEVPDDYILSRGDLIVAMTEQAEGLLGSSALIPEDGLYLHNQRLGLIEEIQDADSRFLYYLFNSLPVRQQIRASCSGVKVRHTSPSRIYEVRARVPDLPTQRRIAGILSAYDDLIENNLRRIRILEEMAQSLYREWFVHFRFPGHDGSSPSGRGRGEGAKPIPLVDSPLGPIPDGWEVKTLGEIAENFDRKRKPLSKTKRAEMQGIYPYYGAAKVFDYLNDYIFDGEYLLMAEDGSVITSEQAPVLQLATGKFWANNHTHVLRGTVVSTHFLYLALSTFNVSGYITGAAQPKITQANMNRMPFVCGPRETHAAFDRLVEPMVLLWQSLESRNETLRQTRDLLLPKLLTPGA